MQRIVLKLGGSLLHQPDWYNRLWNLVDEVGQHQYLLIVGGGDAVEAMRTLDQAHRLDEIAMHWRCVHMLEYTTDVAFEILQRSARDIRTSRVSDPKSFNDLACSSARAFELIVVDSTAFYTDDAIQQLETNLRPPQAGWRTTTDAIAIYCAALADADRCVLLKSCDIPIGMSIVDAIQTEILDEESLPMYKQYSKVSIRKL